MGPAAVFNYFWCLPLGFYAFPQKAANQQLLAGSLVQQVPDVRECKLYQTCAAVELHIKHVHCSVWWLHYPSNTYYSSLVFFK